MTRLYPDPVAAKAARIDAGNAPRVLDLFCGGGLFSESARQAGGLIIGGLDLDPVAAKTHAANFGPPDHALHDDGPYHHDDGQCDLVEADPYELAAGYDVDIMLASPPCQAHARIGRAKLASLTGERDAWLTDARADLHHQVARHAAALRPLAVIVENVPDAKRTFPQIAASLDRLGYSVRWTVLTGAWFGLPQIRQRLFLIAFHRSLRVTPRFPEPTHFHPLTTGYKAIAAMAESDCVHFIAPVRPRRTLPPAPTVADAIGDLPSLDGNRVPSPPSGYAAALHGSLPVQDHVGRIPSDRDRRIFAAMRHGDDYRHAHMIAVLLLHAEIARRGLTDLAQIDALRQEYVPPYSVEKFRDAWKRLDDSKPSPCLLAHGAKDGYSHIHPTEARTITVREAARLMGVPDDFLLTASGASMSSCFRILGNGVGVPVARAVVTAIFAQMRQAARTAAAVTPPLDRFAVMADRRFLPRSAAVAFAAYPDLWQSPQAAADAMAKRMDADIDDSEAERSGLVLTRCKVVWMRRGFDAWVGRELLPSLAAFLNRIDGATYAQWESRRRRKAG